MPIPKISGLYAAKLQTTQVARETGFSPNPVILDRAKTIHNRVFWLKAPSILQSMSFAAAVLGGSLFAPGSALAQQTRERRPTAEIMYKATSIPPRTDMQEEKNRLIRSMVRGTLYSPPTEETISLLERDLDSIPLPSLIPFLKLLKGDNCEIYIVKTGAIDSKKIKEIVAKSYSSNELQIIAARMRESRCYMGEEFLKEVKGLTSKLRILSRTERQDSPDHVKILNRLNELALEINREHPSRFMDPLNRNLTDRLICLRADRYPGDTLEDHAHWHGAKSVEEKRDYIGHVFALNPGLQKWGTSESVWKYPLFVFKKESIVFPNYFYVEDPDTGKTWKLDQEDYWDLLLRDFNHNPVHVSDVIIEEVNPKHYTSPETYERAKQLRESLRTFDFKGLGAKGLKELCSSRTLGEFTAIRIEPFHSLYALKDLARSHGARNENEIREFAEITAKHNPHLFHDGRPVDVHQIFSDWPQGIYLIVPDYYFDRNDITGEALRLSSENHQGVKRWGTAIAGLAIGKEKRLYLYQTFLGRQTDLSWTATAPHELGHAIHHFLLDHARDPRFSSLSQTLNHGLSKSFKRAKEIQDEARKNKTPQAEIKGKQESGIATNSTEGNQTTVKESRRGFVVEEAGKNENEKFAFDFAFYYASGELRDRLKAADEEWFKTLENLLQQLAVLAE